MANPATQRTRSAKKRSRKGTNKSTNCETKHRKKSKRTRMKRKRQTGPATKIEHEGFNGVPYKIAKKSKRINAFTVGEIHIFEEQARAADEIWKMFQEELGPPLLIAQLQQGKTNCCIAVIAKFIIFITSLLRVAREKGKELPTFEIFYILNISDNDLRSQTQFRIKKAGLGKYVKVMHLSELKRYNVDKDVDYRLIMVDECHLALDRKVKDKFRPFHDFMKRCGVDYGRNITTWGNNTTNNFVLSVSATPYAHATQMALTEIDTHGFRSVWMPISDDYYSLEDMLENKRLFEADYCVTPKTKKVTPFFKERMEEFVDLCDAKGNGHMIVRAIGEAPQAIVEYINENFPDIEVNIFDNENNNISLLHSVLTDTFPAPQVVIIRGSMRAGKTIETTQHIHMWVDTKEPTSDTMCQSIGRCLGYEMVDGKNRRKDDDFPIYCNIKEVDLIIQFWKKHQGEAFPFIPSGNRNRSSHKFSRFIYQNRETFIVGLTEKQKENMYKKERTNIKGKRNTSKSKERTTLESSITKTIKDNMKRKDKKFKPQATDMYHISITSRASVNDYCGFLLGKAHSGIDKDAMRSTRIFYVDGPNENFLDSYNELKEKHPEMIGKVVFNHYYDESTEMKKITKNADENKLKRNTLLS